MSAETGIVGRDPLVRRLLDRADRSEPAGALQLAGEAGIGKTRLAAILTARARAHGRTVLEGRAEAGEAALPLGVFQDALRAALRSGAVRAPPREPLAATFPARLLPELSDRSASAGAGRGELFESACAYVRSLASGGGVHLVLEDLHWADATSLDLAHYVVRGTAGAPVGIVLTYRIGEPPGESALDGLRRRLARDRLGEEVILAPLLAPAVTGMLEAILERRPDPEVARAVFAASGGNPYVVEEIVRDAVESGRLDPNTGRWTGSGGAPPLPWTVRELVLDRVRRLPDDVQELLRWAALVGARFDLRLLAGAAGRGEVEALHALDVLCASGLVDETPDASGLRFAFHHSLTREAVLTTMLVADRRRRHARILGLAEDLYGDGADAPLDELAGHALGAGDRRRAFVYSSLAARRSLDLAGYPEAEGHLARALDLWQPSDGEEAKASLLLEYGRLLARLRRDPRAPALLDEAHVIHASLGDRVAAAQALAASAGTRWNAGERAGVLEELRTAGAELRPEDPVDARLSAGSIIARALLMAGEPRAARRTADEALAALPASPAPAQRRGEIHLRTTLGSASWLMGDADAGDEILADALRLARDHRDELGTLRALSDLTHWHLNRSARSAARFADEGLALARDREVDLPLAWLSSGRALVHLKSGRWRDAEPLLRDAEDALARLGPDPELRLSLCWARGEWLLVTGREAEGVAALAPAAAEADRLGDLQLVTRLRRTLARAQLAGDDPAGAGATLAPALARWRAAEGGSLTVPIRVLVTAAEIAASGGAPAEGRRDPLALEERPPVARVRYARGLLGAADPRALAAACDDVEADGWGFETARMRLHCALVLAEAAPGDAAEAAGRAGAAFGDLGLEAWRHRTTVLLRALGVRPPASPRGSGILSARELEVLRLVCDGASNPRIAEELVISRKTAARHVANIFVKLGVHSRAEATRIAVERGLLEPHAPR